MASQTIPGMELLSRQDIHNLPTKMGDIGRLASRQYQYLAHFYYWVEDWQVLPPTGRSIDANSNIHSWRGMGKIIACPFSIPPITISQPAIPPLNESLKRPLTIAPRSQGKEEGVRLEAVTP